MIQKERKINPYHLGIIAVGVIARLLPHAPNFTPTGAIAFFSGSKLPGLTASLIVLGILAVSDLLIGWHGAMLFVYAGFLISVFLGRKLGGSTAGKAGGLALSSLSFFLLTNFGVWLSSNMYPHTVSGLAACYTAAIPFFANDLAATLIYGAAFFAASSLIEKKAAAMEAASKG